MSEQARPDANATGAYDAAAPMPAERFAPGMVLGGRYRIVAALGKGGMGEVWRADDLTLGQPVALKFLPPHLADDPDRLARFRKEVAIARKVSHPNCCRVYDLAEADGHPLLTMEYIDGEDVASLVRRVGRLPEERAVAVARELCAALAAVHDQGLLHRDLKPANVMLDGRGKVRLTDFGLAAAAADLSASEARSGTPQYMAPEQLAGQPVTPRTDLYALGLVLYELFTGRKAFVGTDRATPPSKPSSHVTGLDPTVERAILRCLERDPVDRPKSALAVAAALPGGDPLAAALAAGETPSPQMVADAPVEGSLPPAVAVGLLAAVVGGLILAAWLNDRVLRQRQPQLPRASPAVLANAAQRVLEKLGRPESPTDVAQGFEWDDDGLAYLRQHPVTPHAGDSSADVRLPTLRFWYRQSPEYFRAVTQLALHAAGSVKSDDPPLIVPDMTGVVLDLRGRLLEYYAVPPLRDQSAGEGAGPDWSVLFADAELDWGRFRGQEVPPRWTPPVYCDRTYAWAGTWPGHPDTPLRVEAGTYRGRVAWFKLIGPWVGDQPGGTFGARPWLNVGENVWLVVVWLCLIAGGVTAHRQAWRGRADLRGGLCLFVYLFALEMTLGLTEWMHHTPSIGLETSLFLNHLGFCVFWPGVITVAYLALEPNVRRRWPGRIIAWRRVLEGRFWDPLVGRDLLIGSAFGVVLCLLMVLRILSPTWFGQPLAVAAVGWPNQSIVFALLMSLDHGILNAMTWMFALLLATALCRREGPAWGVILVLATIASVGDLSGAGVSVGIAFTFVTVGLALVVLRRYGLLALSVSVFVLLASERAPLTLDLPAWYGWRGPVAIVALTTVAAYGAVVSFGGRRLFREGLFGDE
jgi:serine/threonine-protein kinase